MTAPSWQHKNADPAFAEKAVDWLRSRAESDAPFFLYLASSAPHEPCVDAVVPEFARGRSDAGPRGDLVWLYDWMVGRVLEVLDETGRSDNTFIMVTSDNGALPGDRVRGNTGMEGYNTWGHKSCGDWRGYKAHIWEGGHREPFIARWPEVIEPGSTCNHLVGLNDFLATCADIADVELHAREAEDSVSFAPLLRNPGCTEPVRSDLIHHSVFGVFSVRKGPWKLIVDCDNSGGWPPPRGTGPKPGTPGQLYDIVSDPGEKDNLWESRQDLVEELTTILDKTIN
jgi:arylsulfatase A-like enzyme